MNGMQQQADKGTGPAPDDHRRQARLVALVIAGTLVVWLAVQWIGREMGWGPRFAFLFDFAAIGGFVWALIVTWRIWRATRQAAPGPAESKE